MMPYVAYALLEVLPIMRNAVATRFMGAAELAKKAIETGKSVKEVVAEE